MIDHIPEGFVLVRTTDVFDDNTVPPGLLKAHRVGIGVWGRLVVYSGSVGFVFEDDPDAVITLVKGHAQVIPPGRLHHIELSQPTTFAIEFYRQPANDDIS